MTRYMINCKTCANKLTDGNEEWCKPAVEGKRTIYLSMDTAGTVDDPDLIMCDHYIEGQRIDELK